VRSFFLGILYLVNSDVVSVLIFITFKLSLDAQDKHAYFGNI